MIELRVAPAKLYPPCQTSFVCGRKSYTKMRLPYNPLFEVAKRIEFAPTDSYFDQVLQVLNGDKTQVNIFCAEDVVRLAQNYFQAQLRIDCDSVGNALINAALIESDMTAFDSLSDEVLCNGLINAQNKPTDHAKLEKAVGNYLELSIRSEEGKRLVRSLTNNVRPVERRGKVEAEVHPALQRGFNPLNAKSILDSNLAKELKKTQVKGEAEPTKSDAPLQPVDSRKRGKPTKHSTSPSPGKYSSESRQDNFEKQVKPPQNDGIEEVEQEQESRRDAMSRSERRRWDEMILLGTNGDTNENWRDRYRPRKYEARPIKEQLKENIEPQLFKSKVFYDLPIIFEYTKKGETFDFSKLKLPALLNIQPENIDILLEPKQLTITKNGKGFRRSTDYDFIRNGLYAEGLTLLLNGVSNIEDGGTVIGGAKLSDIVGDCGWVIIQNLVIYQK